ncbi:MAG: LysR family transcriptional regulator [Proteobacteria bacterium]|nr:LysR family transcriptional regulator [Pseudomonadota bacterium]
MFARNRHGAEPTDFGYLFLQQAAAVSAQVADLEREVALAKGLHKGELAIGFGPYAAELLLPHALPRFVSAHPALRVRIQVDSLEVRSTQPCKAEGAAPPPHCHADISPHRPASGPPTAARH